MRPGLPPTPFLPLALVGLTAIVSAQPAAPSPAPVSFAGVVTAVDASARKLSVQVDGGAATEVVLHQKAAVLKVAPGATSLQNAAPIEFAKVAVGDRVLVRGGKLDGATVSGALRVVVMARTDLAARNEAEQRAWRERGVNGIVLAVDAARNEISIRQVARASRPADSAANGGPPASPTPTPSVTIAVDENTTLHRYADTSVRFDDARPAKLADVAVKDQIRILGARSQDGARIAAEKIVFGSFRTAALEIERLETATGEIFVKDLESNRKFVVTLATQATLRRIPEEMKPMIQLMVGGGRGAAPFRRPGTGGGVAPPAGGMPPGAAGGRGGAGMGGPGSGPGARGMEDMVERMPAITISDLRKSDWIGAVISRLDPSGKVLAFNLLAGIDAFATRTAFGGVDVGFDSGLLESALAIQ